MARHRTLALALLALLASACSSTSSRLERMYRSTVTELDGKGILAGTDEDFTRRQEGRFEKVRELLAAGEVESAKEHFYAGLILSGSQREDDLRQARELGYQANALGEPLGLPVAAEAEDKLLRLKDRPQRWGTQISYEPVLRRWRLDPLDPTTTDEDRAAMGLPPLEQVRGYVDELNAMPLVK